MQNSEILTVDHVDFSYREKKTLNDISFSVKEGEICGLLGPNRSGKTTLLKCINRILHNHAASIRIHGHDISRLSREEIAEMVAMVPQELNIAFSFTVLETMLMAGECRYNKLFRWREADGTHSKSHSFLGVKFSSIKNSRSITHPTGLRA